ncbi:NADH-quinone oxidoreductase subunit J [Mycobacterium intracellulare]|uniref:NADH-quinone oxidoreductase subunit J n=1 Tax=Mycobacterium intracellulare TaxID=1767 RepID=UPI0009301C4B|nr:NADH-quinone oxidoreductase subunit J [Mycobacterium intracellulare]
MNTTSVALAAAEPVVRTTTAEAVLFWVLGALAVVAAIGVVAARKAVYSAIFLAVTMIVLAVLYIAQDAPFLGIVQVVVYAGAVMMLFLFVVMLIGVDSSESLVETLRGQRISTIIAGVGFGVILAGVIGNVSVVGFAGLHDENASLAGRPAGLAPAGNVEGLAALIFTRYLWVFEVTGALLITAILGAMVLTHRERVNRRKGQRELAQERFRPGGHPTPLPNPGVYAHHNAVDIPARLPDGTLSDLSVSRSLERRGVVLTLLVAETETTSRSASKEGVS